MKVSNTSREQVQNYRDIALKFGLDNTPIIDFSGLSHNSQVKIYAKDESRNVTGSVKVRSALFNLVKAVEGSRQHFLDASSGNYAKALIFLTSQLGYESTLFVPESFSKALQTYMSEQGLEARLLFEGIRNSDEAREGAQQYAREHLELTFLDQYDNEGSWLCHYHFTAEEVLLQLDKLRLIPTHFVSGIGSGGTLVGVGKRLKEVSSAEIVGLESRVPHSIKGIRCLETATTPRVYSRSSHIVDRLESIDPEEVARFSDTYSFDFGVSAYANIFASIQLSQHLEKGVILTVIPDGGLQ